MKSNPRLKLKMLVQRNECGVFYDEFLMQDSKFLFSGFREVIACCNFLNFRSNLYLGNEAPEKLFSNNPKLCNEFLGRLDSALVQCSGYNYSWNDSQPFNKNDFSKKNNFKFHSFSRLKNDKSSEVNFEGSFENKQFKRQFMKLLVINMSKELQRIGSVFQSVQDKCFVAVIRDLYCCPTQTANIKSASTRKTINKYLEIGFLVYSFRSLRLNTEQLMPFKDCAYFFNLILTERKKTMFYPYTTSKEKYSQIELDEYRAIRNMFEVNINKFETRGLVLLEPQMNQNVKTLKNISKLSIISPQRNCDAEYYCYRYKVLGEEERLTRIAKEDNKESVKDSEWRDPSPTLHKIPDLPRKKSFILAERGPWAKQNNHKHNQYLRGKKIKTKKFPKRDKENRNNRLNSCTSRKPNQTPRQLKPFKDGFVEELKQDNKYSYLELTSQHSSLNTSSCLNETRDRSRDWSPLSNSQTNKKAEKKNLILRGKPSLTIT